LTDKLRGFAARRTDVLWWFSGAKVDGPSRTRLVGRLLQMQVDSLECALIGSVRILGHASIARFCQGFAVSP
jgi:hypothetical protein